MVDLNFKINLKHKLKEITAPISTTIQLPSESNETARLNSVPFGQTLTKNDKFGCPNQSRNSKIKAND